MSRVGYSAGETEGLYVSVTVSPAKLSLKRNVLNIFCNDRTEGLTGLMRVDTDWLGFVRLTVTRNDLGTFNSLVLQGLT